MKEQQSYYQHEMVLPDMPSSGVRIFTGRDALWLPENYHEAFAEQVSAKLAEKPNTMLQWSPQQLVTTIQEGRAALITESARPDRLLAFAQAWEYQYDLFRYIHAPEGNFRPGTKRKVVELGSWLNLAPPELRKGLGFTIFREVIKAGTAYDPDALQIAIIEQGNVRAQRVMEDLGGIKIGHKPSPVLKDPAGYPATMYIYDVTPHGIL